MVGPLTRQSLPGACCVALCWMLFANAVEGAELEHRQRWAPPATLIAGIEFTATPARFPWVVAARSEDISWPEIGIAASLVALPSEDCIRIEGKVFTHEGIRSEISNPNWVGNCPPPPIQLIDVPSPPTAAAMAAGVWTLIGFLHFRTRARQR